MGRGVYSSDFQGTGGTFLVSGTLCTQEDYEAYLADARQTPEAIVASVEETGDPDDSPMSYDTWAQQEVDDQYENLASTIQDVASAFPGAISATTGGLRENRAGFDREFVMLLDAGPVQVGLRGWEHDYVVGAGADHSREYDSPQDMIANPDAYAKDQLDNGYISSDYANRATALSEDLLAYVRLELQDNGFECRFPTSGWTTSVYSKSEHPSTDKAELARRINENLAYFNSKHPLDDLIQSREGRVALTKQVLEILNDDDNYGAVQVRVPLYYPDQENVAYFDGFEISRYSDAQCMYNAEISPELLATFEPQEGEVDQYTLYHIPRNEQTEAWFAEQQAHITKARPSDNIVIVSADEFFAATGVAIPNRLDEEELEDDQRPRP